jgi:MSHA biogenesis protein MshN
MSLINKMLQDLDARGGAADGAMRQQQLLAVPPAERDRRPAMLAGGALAVLVVVGAAWAGWHHWRGSATAPVAGAAPVPAAAPASTAATVLPPTQPAAVAAPVTAAPKQAASVAAASVAAASIAEPPAGPAVAAASEPVPTTAKRKRATETVAPSPRRVAIDVPASSDARPAAGTVTRDISPTQMAENTYRRALVALQEGRLSAAMADLERALEIDPRNDAARQTYVSLLLENKRNDDAVRQLRLALGIDPRQPGLAMLLARLQLERGGPALETLMTTLPYAGNSAEYQGFLAGVLQREQRHAEAAQHYRDALKLSPQNGVWWMGLGISLQADQHLPEARAAFTRARSTGALTPELQAFVDRKLEQLSR